MVPPEVGRHKSLSPCGRVVQDGLSLQNAKGPRVQTPSSLGEMRRIIAGFSLTVAVSSIAELGIADHLAEGPKTAAALAALTGANEDFLRRVLRYLASEGVFEERDGDIFALTERSVWLRSDVPGSLRPRAIFAGSQLNWTAWGFLPQSIRAGTSGIQLAFNESLFEYLKTHPDAAAIFNRFMAQQTAASVEALLNSYDFRGIREIVDVGGGHGALVAGILKAHPEMRGILFDLPEVIATARTFLDRIGVSDRCKLVGGSFFSEVPAGSDLYVLKFILHDWPDDECKQILNNCQKAMARDGTLLIVEHVLPEGKGPDFARFMDVNMLVLTAGGRERTRQEFADLLNAAELQLKRLLFTPIGLRVLECGSA